MIRTLILALLIPFLAACKKQEVSVAPPPATTDQTQPAVPTNAPTLAPEPVVIAADNPDVTATLAQLSQSLRAYVSSTRSLPKDFADFAARTQLQAPPPPPGKAYAISHGKVVLVDQ
jgi:hypothetical protein